MRIQHNLWRVSNGWLLVPEGENYSLNSKDALNCAVFKTLKEFSDNYPKRERRKPKTKTEKETSDANQH